MNVQEKAIAEVEFELAKLQKENNESKERIKDLEANLSVISKRLVETGYWAT